MVKHVSLVSRSPCGGRGLKYVDVKINRIATVSLPLRGAWIEMQSTKSHTNVHKVAPLAGGVD